jgi:hypothetical protein
LPTDFDGFLEMGWEEQVALIFDRVDVVGEYEGSVSQRGEAVSAHARTQAMIRLL